MSLPAAGNGRTALAKRPLLLGVYGGVLGTVGSTAARVLLRRRQKQGKEDASRIAERRGHPGQERPDGPLVWVHAASVGEFTSVLPLVDELDGRGLSILVTTGTLSSAQLAQTRLPAGVIHQFMPLDVPSFMQRFLAHWRPDLVVLTESEIWPNLLHELQRGHVPVVIANARMSERSFLRWRRSGAAVRAVLEGIHLCLAQSDADAERLSALGAPRVQSTGNLKFDVPPPPAAPVPLAKLKTSVFGRRVIIAASTHPGEHGILVEAHRRLRADTKNLLTIIVPRHPDAADEIARLAEAAGIRAARRSERPEPAYDTGIFIVDTIGELGLFYRIAELAFVGGSLVAHGGQNPIEPAKLGIPILHGPHVRNFTEIYGALDSAEGALEVRGVDDLSVAASALLADADSRELMRRAARDVMQTHSGALQRTLAALEPYLMQLSLNRP
jgi:3-deoxy-D-manno-octulosonic-acid transferase